MECSGRMIGLRFSNSPLWWGAGISGGVVLLK